MLIPNFIPLLLIIITSHNAAPVEETVYKRYDIDEDAFHNSQMKSYLMTSFPASTKPISLTPPSSKELANDTVPFSIDFTCSASDTALCSKAQTGFTNAGTRIAGLLNIKQQIKIKATFRSFWYHKLSVFLILPSLAILPHQQPELHVIYKIH